MQCSARPTGRQKKQHRCKMYIVASWHAQEYTCRDCGGGAWGRAKSAFQCVPTRYGDSRACGEEGMPVSGRRIRKNIRRVSSMPVFGRTRVPEHVSETYGISRGVPFRI
jgi:hypothetical protein